MSLATATGQANLLKRLHGNDIAKPMYDKSKFLSKIKKDTGFHGTLKEIVVNIAPTAGGSADFAEAVDNQAPTNNKKFEVRRKREYSVFSIENELIHAGKAGVGAIVDALKHESGAALQLFHERMTRRAWSAGGGALGTIDAGVNLATTTLTFDNRTDVIGGIHIGAKLTFSSDSGTALNPAGLRGSGQYLTVAGINRQTGAVTTSAALNTISGITVGDFVHIKGDYANAITGLPGWAPTAAPSPSESFFGLDRSIDADRLAGVRVAWTTDFRTTINQAGAEAQIYGITPKELFVNPLQYQTLLNELDDLVRVHDGKATVGYSSVRIHLPSGEVEIISEPYVPFGFGWMGDSSEMFLGTSGECPSMLTEGNGKHGLMLIPTQDAYQGRLGCYGNIYPKDRGKGPGGWMIVDLAA